MISGLTEIITPAAQVLGSHLRQPTNRKARGTADLRARSAVGCNPLLARFPFVKKDKKLPPRENQ